MSKFKLSKWGWYLVLFAVVCGLFAPTVLAANMAELPGGIRCPIPATGDVLQ